MRVLALMTASTKGLTALMQSAGGITSVVQILEFVHD